MLDTIFWTLYSDLVGGVEQFLPSKDWVLLVLPLKFLYFNLLDGNSALIMSI